ncbi:MAG: hypothetical protein ACREQW_03225 [Candidatus Binatia bacterium]
MKTLRTACSLLFAGALLLSAGGCKKDSQGEGPAEQAGKQVDQAMERAGEELGKALERGGDAAKEAGKDLQKETGK